MDLYLKLVGNPMEQLQLLKAPVNQCSSDYQLYTENGLKHLFSSTRCLVFHGFICDERTPQPTGVPNLPSRLVQMRW